MAAQPNPAPFWSVLGLAEPDPILLGPAGQEGPTLIFFFKILWINAVFFHMIVFMNFFSKLVLSIFFNIELVKNYNYNKTKSYGESVVVFLTKHCRLLQYFSKWFFYDSF